MRGWMVCLGGGVGRVGRGYGLWCIVRLGCGFRGLIGGVGVSMGVCRVEDCWVLGRRNEGEIGMAWRRVMVLAYRVLGPLVVAALAPPRGLRIRTRRRLR